MYFFVPLLSGSFPVLDLRKELAELRMELQRLRREGEYKLFIDSLSEK